MPEPTDPNPHEPILLTVPPVWKFAFSVYFKATGSPPEESALLPIVTQWVDRHASGPLRTALHDTLARGVVALQMGTRDFLPEPLSELIEAYQPGELEERRFRDASHVIAVWAPDLPGHDFLGLWAAVAAARALAAASGGVIYDGEVGRLLSERTYLDPLPSDGRVAVADFSMIPSSLDQLGRGWVTTSGLRRFQIPELEVRNIPPNLIDDLWMVVNAVGQRLLEAISTKNTGGAEGEAQVELGPELRVSLADVARSVGELPSETPEGARGWTTVRLEETDEGYLRIVRPQATQVSHGEWLHSVLSDLTGSQDTLRFVEGGTAEMETAHRRALAELPRVKERFRVGLPVGCVLYVKHGFPHGDGEREYMWLAVNTWEGTQVRCQLVNTPAHRMDLRAGQQFDLDEAELYDWYLTWPDGRTEGGYTTQVVEGPDRE